MKVTIDVTQDDIDNGEVGDGCACAVYLAIMRAVPSPRHLSVGVTHAYWYAGDDYADLLAEVELPEQASAFIARSDRDFPVEPFSFDLDVLDSLMAEVAS